MHVKQGDYLTSILFILGVLSPFIGIGISIAGIGDSFTNIMISVLLVFPLLWLWATRVLEF